MVRKENAEFGGKVKGPSVEQKLFGGGNVVLREANRIEELADIIADLGVALEPSTFPESRNGWIRKHRNSVKSRRERKSWEGKPCSGSCGGGGGGGLRSPYAEKRDLERGRRLKKVRWGELALATGKDGAAREVAHPHTAHLHFLPE